ISGVDYHTNIQGGFRNDGPITVISQGSTATGVAIGRLATVPQMVNTNTINVSASGNNAGQSAIGLKIEAGASLPSLNNPGTSGTTFRGAAGGHVSILDLTGTPTSIRNTGVTGAVVAPLDDGDASNGVETASGTAVAFDLSATSNPITVINDVPPDFDPTT